MVHEHLDRNEPSRRGRSGRAAFLIGCWIATVVSVRADVTVTHVANEGFLISSEDGKVLIDALFDAGIAGYTRVPQRIRPALEGATPPFDAIDWVLATHYHADHFGPEAVMRHLRANPRAWFVSTPQAVAALGTRLDDLPDRGVRVHESLPGEGETASLSRGDLKVTVLNLHHGLDRDPPVQNLGFVIETGGMKLLHVGDTEAGAKEFGRYHLVDRGIDVAFLPVWFLTIPEWVDVVRSEIRPVEIVVMHVATPDAPASYFGRDGSRVKRLETVKRNFPDARLLVNAGDAWTFEKPAN